MWRKEKKEGLQQQADNSLVGGHMIQAGRDVNLASGSRIGKGIWRWDDWLDRCQKGHRGPVANATRLYIEDKTVERGFGEKEYQISKSHLTSASKNALFQVLYGKHGSGLTVHAVRTVAGLVASIEELQAFVVDDVHGFHSADLTFLENVAYPTLLFIDDADKHNSFGPLNSLLATGSAPLLIMAACTDPTYGTMLESLNGRKVRPHRLLPSMPTEFERSALKGVYGESNLSNSDKKQLRRANFRSYVAILSGQRPTDHLTRLLMASYINENRIAQEQLHLLLHATAEDILVPQSLLRIIGNGSIVPALLSWCQMREIPGAKCDAETLVWIEDRVAAKESLNTWFSWQEVSRRAAEKEQVSLCIKFLSQTNDGEVTHRVFVRQLLSALGDGQRSEVVNAIAEKVKIIVQQESRRDFAWIWIPLLRGTKLDSFDFGHTLGDLLDPREDSGTDLLLALYHLGPWATAIELGQRISDATSWSETNWARCLALLDLFPDEEARGLTRICMPLLRGSLLDIGKLLGIANSLQILSRLVTNFGLASDRQWLLAHVRDADSFNVQRVHAARQLSDRCLMQPRNSLAITTFQSLVEKGGIGAGSLLRKYDELYAREQSENQAGMTFDFLQSQVKAVGPRYNKANNIWIDFLKFARIWAFDVAEDSTRSGMDYVIEAHRSGSLSHLVNMYRVALVNARWFGVFSVDDVPPLLAILNYPISPAVHGGLLIDAARALISLNNGVTVSATEFLEAMIKGSGADIESKTGSFVDGLAGWANLTPSYDLPVSISEWNARHVREILAVDLIPASRLSNFGTHGDYVQQLMHRWRPLSGAGARSALLQELLGIGAYEEALELLPDEEQCSPDELYMLAACYAGAGSFVKARQMYRRALRIYKESGKGAHPSVISRSASIMSKFCSGSEQEQYFLISRLVRLGSLKPRPGVLHE